MGKLFQTFQSTLKIEIRALELTNVFIKKHNVETAVKFLLSTHKNRGRIFTTGVGKCSYIAEKTAATFSSYGFKTHFVHPVEALHGDMGKLAKEDILLIFSKSGHTQELLDFVKVLPPLIRILITGNDTSILMSSPELLLQITFDDEGDGNNIAPMASTTAMLAIADGLCAAMVDSEGLTKKDFAKHHPGGTLGANLLCTVEDLMETNPEYLPIMELDEIKPWNSITLSKLLLPIATSRYGAVFILQNETLWGIFTDGDLRRLMNIWADQPFSELTIGPKSITHPPRTIPKKALAIDALRLMEKEPKITVLPVIDIENNLIGAIHIHDLIKAGIS